MCCSSEPPYLKVLAVSLRQAAFCSGVHVAASTSILVRRPGSSSCKDKYGEGAVGDGAVWRLSVYTQGVQTLTASSCSSGRI